MKAPFTTRRTVEFAETDLAGIAHFSNFFRWMESAEHEFVRSLGGVVHGQEEDLRYGFARAHASCDYRRSVTYLDELEIEVRLTQRSSKSLTYAFRFVRLPAQEGEEATEVATGRLEVVCVTKPPGSDRIRATNIPPALEAALESALDPDPAP